MKPKILFVGMVNSPHVARWIELIADMGWDLHFFPVYSADPHPLLQGVTIQQPWNEFSFIAFLAKFKPFNFLKHEHTEYPLPVQTIFNIPMLLKVSRFLNTIKLKLGESEADAPLPYGPHMLARLIKKLKPDLIHSMEFQHAGYNVLRAKEILGEKYFPKWIATNWGSDIFYFRQFPKHYQQITRLLKGIDYYSCECARDMKLAEEMGLKANFKLLLLNSGGFDLSKIKIMREKKKPSDRKLIMIKGYQHFAGRALNALEAIVECQDILKDYTIIVYSASVEILSYIEKLQIYHGLRIMVFKPLALSHNFMLNLFAHARLYIGISISDAVSTSMVEAMAMGAFPIQTNTACCDEWIIDGSSGYTVPPDDKSLIASCIREALKNDDLVNNAAGLNWTTISDRLNNTEIKKKKISFYQNIFDDLKQRNSK